MICHVIGDSIAVGTAAYMPWCARSAKVGISSAQFERTLMPHAITADLVVISLGANDMPSDPATMRRVRGAVTARRVVWLLPAVSADHRAAIRGVAAEHGDQVIDTAPYVRGHGVHPDGVGYRALSALSIAGGKP